MDPMEAIAAAGLYYRENVMEPEFDYPLNFFVRGDDMVLGDMTEEARGIKFVLRPFDLYFEWYIEDESEVENFLIEFTKAFDKCLVEINRW